MHYTSPKFLFCLLAAISSCKDVFSNKVENSVDPDQMASSEASYKQKYVHKVLVNCLVKLSQKKRVVR